MGDTVFATQPSLAVSCLEVAKFRLNLPHSWLKHGSLFELKAEGMNTEAVCIELSRLGV